MQLSELTQQHLYYINDLHEMLGYSHLISHLPIRHVAKDHVEVTEVFDVVPRHLQYQIFDESDTYNVKHKTLLML